MILEIRLSNFYSIKDEIVLDLRAGNSKSQKIQNLISNTFPYKQEQLLKSAAIYGANASGKSNIIKAIQKSIYMILDSHLFNVNTFFDVQGFKLDTESSLNPSNFFIRFVINDIEYEYSFSFSMANIYTEELYYYPNGRKTKVFTRNEVEEYTSSKTLKEYFQSEKNKKDIYSFGKVIRKPFDVAENTSVKNLFISRASQFDRGIAKEIVSFFAEKISFGLEPDKVELLFTDNKEKILKALQIADSDIENIEMEKIKHQEELNAIEKGQITKPEENLYYLNFKTYHKENVDVEFHLSEESEGTQKMFYTVLNIIDVVKNNKTLFIDEIERSLHSKIVEYIIGLFHAGKYAQLIYTTHNTSLLNLNKLRKDQIYFVNKRQDGSSDLYSLFDYKDFRDTMDLEKAYLHGRFDAIPYINDNFEDLKALVQ